MFFIFSIFYKTIISTVFVFPILFGIHSKCDRIIHHCVTIQKVDIIFVRIEALFDGKICYFLLIWFLLNLMNIKSFARRKKIGQVKYMI